jgi:hypothetical protein
MRHHVTELCVGASALARHPAAYDLANDREDRVELRPARGQQSSSMLLVYLAAQRLLYASDVVLPDAFEPVFAAGYWAELGRVVRREGPSVERVFAEHLPATAWGDRAR